MVIGLGSFVNVSDSGVHNLVSTLIRSKKSNLALENKCHLSFHDTDLDLLFA